jgi:hypothetical protein
MLNFGALALFARGGGGVAWGRPNMHTFVRNYGICYIYGVCRHVSIYTVCVNGSVLPCNPATGGCAEASPAQISYLVILHQSYYFLVCLASACYRVSQPPFVASMCTITCIMFCEDLTSLSKPTTKNSPAAWAPWARHAHPAWRPPAKTRCVCDPLSACSQNKQAFDITSPFLEPDRLCVRLIYLNCPIPYICVLLTSKLDIYNSIQLAGKQNNPRSSRCRPATITTSTNLPAKYVVMHVWGAWTLSTCELPVHEARWSACTWSTVRCLYMKHGEVPVHEAWWGARTWSTVNRLYM